MSDALIPVLYNHDRQIASLLKTPYEIRRNLRVDDSRLRSTYLALIELTGINVDVQFYRVIGRKGECVVATPHHLEDVDQAFVNQFTDTLVKSHILSETIRAAAVSTDIAPQPPPPREPKDVSQEDTRKPVSKPAVKKGGENRGFLSSMRDLFNRKRLAGKVYFAGADALDVIRAQDKITDVLNRAKVKRVEFEEVVTPKTLMSSIEREKGAIIVADIDKLKNDPGWHESIDSLERMGIRIVDIHDLLESSGDESILVHFQNVPNIDIKAVLYTRQRRIMMVNNTGGVGKTTLALNLGHWLASKNASALYMEILGSSGIDDILSVQSATVENLLYGVEQIAPAKIKNAQMYFASLADDTNSIIGDANAWERWFEQSCLNREAQPYLHALIVDTYTHMLSTRYLLPFMTDILIVSDMRQTTNAATIDTLRSIINLLPPDQPMPNFMVIHNQYPIKDTDADLRLGRLTSELDGIAEERKIKLSHLVIPADPAFYGIIRIYDDPQRYRLIGGIVELLYGIKLG